MKGLEYYRKKINSLDEFIYILLEKRAEHAHNISKIKKENNLPIRNGKREQEILKRIIDMNESKYSNSAIRRIFRCIIDETTKTE